MGLLLSHKRAIRVYRDLVTVSELPGNKPTGGGERGDITVFSSGSRFRLFRLLHTLEFETLTFCTLTYPAEFPTDHKIYKAHLKEWRRRIEREYGKKACVWRLEFQKRGAPHFHLLYLDFGFVPVQILCNIWASVTHSNSEAHKKIGVDVKLCTKGTESKLAATYIAKYVAKIDDSKQSDQPQKVGRWWGKWNIEEEKPTEYIVADYEAADFVERMIGEESEKGWRPANKTRCTIFGSAMGTDQTSKKAEAILGSMPLWSKRKLVPFEDVSREAQEAGGEALDNE